MTTDAVDYGPLLRSIREEDFEKTLIIAHLRAQRARHQAFWADLKLIATLAVEEVQTTRIGLNEMGNNSGSLAFEVALTVALAAIPFSSVLSKILARALHGSAGVRRAATSFKMTKVTKRSEIKIAAATDKQFVEGGFEHTETIYQIIQESGSSTDELLQWVTGIATDGSKSATAYAARKWAKDAGAQPKKKPALTSSSATTDSADVALLDSFSRRADQFLITESLSTDFLIDVVRATDFAAMKKEAKDKFYGDIDYPHAKMKSLKNEGRHSQLESLWNLGFKEDTKWEKWRKRLQIAFEACIWTSLYNFGTREISVSPPLESRSLHSEYRTVGTGPKKIMKHLRTRIRHPVHDTLPKSDLELVKNLLNYRTQLNTLRPEHE